MTTRPRGRPRSFDLDRALDRALEVFWSHGLAASSLDDLCEAMAIARPSLYAAFGDKQDLYLAATARFRDRMALAYRNAMVGTQTYRDGVLAYLRAAIGHYTSGNVSRGCLAVCTATAEAAVHPRIRGALAALIHDLDEAFAGTLRRARDRGELPATADPETLAQLLSATQHSIAVRARAGTSVDELDRIACAGVALVFGDAPARHAARDRTRDGKASSSPDAATGAKRPGPRSGNATRTSRAQRKT
jgi:AcrR family transcriptional regulator